MGPPRRAVVLSSGETTQIRAVARTRPSRPIKSGPPETQTHDYIRHGTATLFVALIVPEGTVVGRCVQCHRGYEFLRFLKTAEAGAAGGKVTHMI